MHHDSSDLLLVGGRIHPLGDHPPAEALLVRGGKVRAVGTEAEVRAAATGATREIHLEGATVTPGLVDAHVHLTAWAMARRRVDLRGTPSADEGARRTAEAAPPGEGWVLGRGWDPQRWGGFPSRLVLDRHLPGRPVLLESHDLHACWLNSEALRRCGIDRETPDPEGGEILKDPATGEPTGVLLENATRLAYAFLPVVGAEEVQGALVDAQREAHRLGITGVHSVEATGLADFGRLRQDDLLRLRVLQYLPLDHLDEAAELGLRSGFGGDWMRIGGVKMFLDGTLGSRTAWMREPFEGGGDTGVQTLSTEEFRTTVREGARAGISTAVHAIGDAAVALALEVLSETPAAALPHRIEHLQLCPPDLWDMAASSGVVASMQPVHLRTDIPAAESHWGHPRSRGAFAFAPLLARGMVLAFGSDVPVETIDPRPGLVAATQRVGWDGEPEGGWYPEHRLTPLQALQAYTEGPARAAAESDRRGRLLPGYDADLVAWDRDPLEGAGLEEMRCMMTVVAGEIVHGGNG